MNRFTQILLITVPLLFLAITAHSDTGHITTIQALSFGQIAVIDNLSAHTVLVEPNGDVTYDSKIVANVEGHRGEYDFTGLPANVTFYVGTTLSNPPAAGGLILDNQTALSAGGAASFQVSHLTATNLTTDGTGQGTLYIGGTLTTTGTGTNYSSGHYTGQLDITLYY